MFLYFGLDGFESAIAGHTGDKQLPIALLGDGQVPRCEFDGQFLAGAVGRTGTATGPIIQFLELNPEEAGYPSDRIIVLPGGSMKGASWIIGNLFHVFSLFPNALKIS
jgi:hypothetical protein